jgi:hypothetical protein
LSSVLEIWGERRGKPKHGWTLLSPSLILSIGEGGEERTISIAEKIVPDFLCRLPLSSRLKMSRLLPTRRPRFQTSILCCRNLARAGCYFSVGKEERIPVW